MNRRINIYAATTQPPQVKRVNKGLASIRFAHGDYEISLARLTSEKYRLIGTNTPPTEWDGCSRPLNEAISGWADDSLKILQKTRRVQAKERKALQEATQACEEQQAARMRAIR